MNLVVFVAGYNRLVKYLVVWKSYVPRNATGLLARKCHPPRQFHFLESTGLAVSRTSEKNMTMEVEFPIPRRTCAQVPNKCARLRRDRLPKILKYAWFEGEIVLSLPSCNFLSSLAFL